MIDSTTTTISSTYGITPEQASKNFDVLRREATKLERQLEDRVARYQQLAQRLTVDNNTTTTTTDNNDPLGQQQQQSSLMIDSGGSSYSSSPQSNKKDKHHHHSNNNLDEEEATLSKDIHRTMSTMTELINTKMAPAAERTGRSQHLLLVKRYREILFDCGADFNKTSAAVARRREAKELFRGASSSTAAAAAGSNPEMEQLLRERNAIDNSMKSANSVLNQAASVRSELRSQGASLRGVGGTMATIAGNIPGLNGLIDKIRKKRQQDDRVVSGVVAACILFTLWYLFG
ncbi:hypothetical protein ACHAXM_000627 [Skeletonema potamos]